MSRFAIVASALTFLSLSAQATYASEIIPESELATEALALVGNLGLNCLDNIGNIALFKKEVKEIVEGMTKVTTAALTQLALKPDFPTVCHVLTKPQIASYQESKETTDSGSRCLARIGGSCKVREYYKQETLRPSYYWPKYFIEVMEKGNDFHPKFAESNALFTANRKVAALLSSYIDEAGAVSLTEAVLGASLIFQQTPISLGDPDWESFWKAKALTPFEKMRIRADRSKSEHSFEAAIWPVGLSKVVAKYFSVCHSGGYAWGLDAVAQTCPVATSSDAYAYWDTGMLDYLDPQAIAQMSTGVHPASCAAAQVAEKFDSQEGAKRSTPVGSQEGIVSQLGSMTQEMQGALKTCSWPILGQAEAIAKKALSLADPLKWKGPYCTVWGNLAPRKSTSFVASDYSYAHKALQFKLLAHELFSVPRGSAERWSLAYPWEDGATGLSDHPLAGVFTGLRDSFREALGKFGTETKENMTVKFRSEALLSPGSPLLLNAGYGAKYFLERIKQHAKEGAYIAALIYAGQKAGETAREEYLERYGVESDGPAEEMKPGGRLDKELGDAEERTARLDDEAVYKEVKYCHIWREDDGVLFGSQDHVFNVGDLGPIQFSPVESKESCFRDIRGKCKKKNYKRECVDREYVRQVFLIRHVISHYTKKQNPTIFEISQANQANSSIEYSRYDVRHFHEFSTSVNPVGVKDTRDRVARPDISEPKTITNNSETADAIATAAQTATWVGSAVARQKWAEITGQNPIPGDRRIYTVWEKVTCLAPTSTTTKQIGPVVTKKYDDCAKAVQYEVIKFVHLKLLRRICDAMGQKVGTPWN